MSRILSIYEYLNPARFSAIACRAYVLRTTLGNPNDATAERTFFLTLSAATIVLGLVLIAIRRWVVRKFGDVR